MVLLEGYTGHLQYWAITCTPSPQDMATTASGLAAFTGFRMVRVFRCMQQYSLMAVATTFMPCCSSTLVRSAISFSPPVAQAVAQLPQPTRATVFAPSNMPSSSSRGFF